MVSHRSMLFAADNGHGSGGAGEDLENINQLWFLSLTFIGVNPLGMMFGYILRTCSMLWHGHILTLHTAYGQSARARMHDRQTNGRTDRRMGQLWR